MTKIVTIWSFFPFSIEFVYAFCCKCFFHAYYFFIFNFCNFNQIYCWYLYWWFSIYIIWPPGPMGPVPIFTDAVQTTLLGRTHLLFTSPNIFQYFVNIFLANICYTLFSLTTELKTILLAWSWTLLFRHLKCQYFVTSNWHFCQKCFFCVPKNGTLGDGTKVLRPFL